MITKLLAINMATIHELLNDLRELEVYEGVHNMANLEKYRVLIDTVYGPWSTPEFIQLRQDIDLENSYSREDYVKMIELIRLELNTVLNGDVNHFDDDGTLLELLDLTDGFLNLWNDYSPNDEAFDYLQDSEIGPKICRHWSIYLGLGEQIEEELYETICVLKDMFYGEDNNMSSLYDDLRRLVVALDYEEEGLSLVNSDDEYVELPYPKH